MFNKFKESVKASYLDDQFRREVLFVLLNVLLAGISLIMTLINLRTKEYELMGVTAAFCLLCVLNVLLIRWEKFRAKLVFHIFSVEAMVLLVYFVLSGIPEGFSVLWTLLVPAISLAVFGKKMGMQFSALTFVVVAFFFWVPLGRSWLYYDYNDTFMLRFPFVYICMFLASWYLETIRMGAYARVREAEGVARHLYRHDALTDIYTRHAFSEEMQRLFEEPSKQKTSVLMFDVDDFKVINDRYGHNAGDQVLKTVSKIILNNTCEHCISCRWGGEEFLVLMQCQHDPFEISEKIRQIAEETPIIYEEQTIHITLSVGVSVTQSLTKPQVSDFISSADKAMYISKAQGKNQTTLVHYQPKTAPQPESV